MRLVRRFGALTLAIAVAAIVAFAAFYGFVHNPDGGGRTGQVFYATTLLVPPALFLLLALVLMFRQTAGLDILGLIGIAVLVGAPTLVFFLGGAIGIALTVATLGLIVAAGAVLNRRSGAGWPDGQVRQP